MNNYARNFHDLRVKMDIKQNKIAEDLGKSPQAISHWEAGNSAPTLDDLIKVAEYFNVSLELLVRGKFRKFQIMRVSKIPLLRMIS